MEVIQQPHVSIGYYDHSSHQGPPTTRDLPPPATNLAHELVHELPHQLLTLHMSWSTYSPHMLEKAVIFRHAQAKAGKATDAGSTTKQAPHPLRRYIDAESKYKGHTYIRESEKIRRGSYTSSRLTHSSTLRRRVWFHMHSSLLFIVYMYMHLTTSL